MNCRLNRPRAARARGNTILEVMAAMFVLGLLILAVYSAISSGITTVRLARENLRATQIMIGKMEALRLHHWEQLDPSFVATNFIANYDVKSTSTTNGILYFGNIAIEPAATGTTYADAMKLVTVRLYWTNGIPRNREITTYVCRSGLQNYMY